MSDSSTDSQSGDPRPGIPPRPEDESAPLSLEPAEDPHAPRAPVAPVARPPAVPAARNTGSTAPTPPARRPAAAGTVLAEEPELVEQRNLLQLRELMRVLTRALKAKKMYPSNNPVLSRILSEFQDVTMGALEDLGELTFTVQPTELLHNGAPVYTNPAKRDSLAYRFHRDGITELHFESGLTPPELNAFLDVLARATEPQGSEEDLVTLLWEQEFSHIRYAYLAIEDLQESLMDAEGTGVAEEDREVPWPGAGEDSEGTIVVDEADLSGEGSGERSDDWNQLEPASDIAERCPPHLLELTPQELQELAEETHLEHSRPLTDVALEILSEVAEDERNADRFADLARALSDLVIIALSETDLTHATQVLATLRRLSAERGVNASGFLPDTGDLVKQAIASIHHFPEGDTGALPEFLAHLGPLAIDPICDHLQDRNDEALHPQLAAGLSLLAPQAIAKVHERMKSAVGPAASHMLAALAASPLPEVDAALAQAIDHAEARVRRDAVQALHSRRALGKPEIRAKVAGALQDPDLQVRSVALTAVRELASEDAGAQLVSIIESAGFRDRPANEKRSYFEALVRMTRPVFRRTLREWASRQNWWPDAALAERRVLAAWALARNADPDDRSFLSRHAQSIFPGVRKACRKALADAPPVAPRPAGDGGEKKAS